MAGWLAEAKILSSVAWEFFACQHYEPEGRHQQTRLAHEHAEAPHRQRTNQKLEQRHWMVMKNGRARMHVRPRAPQHGAGEQGERRCCIARHFDDLREWAQQLNKKGT